MLVAIILATVEAPKSYQFTSILIGESPPLPTDQMQDLSLDIQRYGVAIQTLFCCEGACRRRIEPGRRLGPVARGQISVKKCVELYQSRKRVALAAVPRIHRREPLSRERSLPRGQ
jgi:hypothetical protein